MTTIERAILVALESGLRDAESDLQRAWDHPNASEVEFELIEGYRDGIAAAVGIVGAVLGIAPAVDGGSGSGATD